MATEVVAVDEERIRAEHDVFDFLDEDGNGMVSSYSSSIDHDVTHCRSCVASQLDAEELLAALDDGDADAARVKEVSSTLHCGRPSGSSMWQAVASAGGSIDFEAVRTMCQRH